MFCLNINWIKAGITFGSLIFLAACGRSAVEPVDLAEPTAIETDSINNPYDSDVELEDTALNGLESPFMSDSSLLDSASLADTSITGMIGPAPANSSLKTIAANFETIEYHNGNCEMIFIAGENQIRFCGAFGEFVDVGQHAANKELIGKPFIIIYKTENGKPDSQSDLYSSDCKTMVFAKPAH